MDKRGLSPATKLSKEKIAVTTKDFGECIKYFQNAHRSLMRLNGLVNKLPYNQPLKIGNYEIRKNQLIKYSQAYISQLGDLRKMYSNRKKKVRSTTKINNLFFVSDQLVEFYKNADLGKLDPSDPDSDDLVDHLELLMKYRLATSGILTSLISRYIDVNKLKSTKCTGRYIPDQNMIDSFTTTKYMLPNINKNGLFDKKSHDITNRKVQNLHGNNLTKINDNLKHGELSPFDRIKDRIDKRKNENLLTKDGLLYTTMMILNNFYRIPTCLLNDDELDLTTNSEKIEMAKELQTKLSYITAWHKKNK